MPAFKIGDRICHLDHGEGTVTFVGEKYVGVAFDGEGSLLRMDSSVRSTGDILGQDAWLVRATVMRLSDYRSEDVDLDILITRKAWEGSEPPRVDQDIEVRLWLQVHLWYPHDHGSVGA